MRAVSLLALAAAGGFLGACGSHAPAPIVYGTQPSTTGRVYHSPADYARVNGAPTRGERVIAIMPSAAPVLSDPLFGSSEPAPAAIHANIEESELPPAPTYLSGTNYAQAPGANEIIVQPGDTVYAIARRTGASPEAIIKSNRLAAPYQLEVGQTIRVPEGKRAYSAAPAEPVYRSEVVAGGNLRTVRPGDTLYSISRATGASVEAIARTNGLRPPYGLEVGDRLQIPAAEAKRAEPKKREARSDDKGIRDLARNVNYSAPAKSGERLFEWPIKGAVIGEYGGGVLGKRNDGVNIAAPVGTPVRAAADGKVVYRGADLDGYGNLLLIKHDDGFVTAYAHNDVMLVEKDQPVRQGQVIAKVGQTGSASEPQLHFEIRQNLKAVDPLEFLQN
ncbi:MAG: M23 family metallopeptidase [Parvularculaceae bacterium]